jgi:hypothetical protein
MLSTICALSVLAIHATPAFAFSANTLTHPKFLNRGRIILDTGLQGNFAKTIRSTSPTFFAVAAAASKKDGKSSKAGGGFATSGFGKKGNGKAAPVVDSATLLRQSMDLYDRLVQSSGSISTSDDENAESDMPELREYVVCVRHSTEAQVDARILQ